MNISDAFYSHVAQTSDHPVGIVIDRAEGPFLYDVNGARYVDFISGIGVSGLGHRHPAVMKAIREQLEHHLHVMVYGEYIQAPQAELADLLSAQLPEQLDRVYFVNSGTEANEGALKMAKKFTGRHKLVSFYNSYHGDTHGSLSVTGRDVYRTPFEPLLPAVQFIRFNEPSDLDAVDSETAAVILEPVQGEGGIIPAQRSWLKKVRKQCDEKGALLIFDEVQTGFGRTGSLFAFQHFDVIPDIMTLAKSMGGGMPIGAFVSSTQIFESLKKDPPLNHVTTFGGHPVSCAAALASLRELISGDYMERAIEIEKTSRSILKGKGIVEIRGLGAMLGLQLINRDLAGRVVADCLKQKIILGWTLHSNTLIRLAPPLIIDQDLLETTLLTIRDIIKDDMS